MLPVPPFLALCTILFQGKSIVKVVAFTLVRSSSCRRVCTLPTRCLSPRTSAPHSMRARRCARKNLFALAVRRSPLLVGGWVVSSSAATLSCRFCNEEAPSPHGGRPGDLAARRGSSAGRTEHVAAKEAGFG